MKRVQACIMHTVISASNKGRALARVARHTPTVDSKLSLNTVYITLLTVVVSYLPTIAIQGKSRVKSLGGGPQGRSNNGFQVARKPPQRAC